MANAARVTKQWLAVVSLPCRGLRFGEQVAELVSECAPGRDRHRSLALFVLDAPQDIQHRQYRIRADRALS